MNVKKKTGIYLVPKYIPLIGAVVLAIYTAILFFIPINDNDIGFHIRLGEQIIKTGSFPGADTFSYTSNAPYLDHEWLAQVLLYFTWHVGGLNGLIILRVILVLSIFMLFYFQYKKNFPLNLLFLIPLIFLLLPHAFIRPHMFSWLLQVILIKLLLEKKYQMAPLVLVVWANMHASFMLALMVTGFYLFREYLQTKEKKILLITALCMLAPLLNPYGYQIFLFSNKIKDYTWFVSEWNPLDIHSGFFWVWVFFLAVVATSVFVRNKAKWHDKLFVLILAILGFTAARFPAVSALYLLPLLFEQYPEPILLKSSKQLNRIMGSAIIALLLAFKPATGYFHSPGMGIDHLKLPVYATEFLLHHKLNGKLYNDYNYGGYLIWKLPPEQKVFVDGRIEVYAGSAMDDYLSACEGKNWEAVFEKYGVEMVLIRPGRKINQALIDSPDWSLIYYDYNSVLYVKRDYRTDLRRINYITPWGSRDKSHIDESINEAQYLIQQNPQFFGGHKILSFLYYRKKMFAESLEHIKEYMRLFPEGADNKETLELLANLKRLGYKV